MSTSPWDRECGQLQHSPVYLLDQDELVRQAALAAAQMFMQREAMIRHVAARQRAHDEGRAG